LHARSVSAWDISSILGLVLRSDRTIDAFILALIVFDVLLIGRVLTDHTWWFMWHHGAAEPTATTWRRLKK